MKKIQKIFVLMGLVAALATSLGTRAQNVLRVEGFTAAAGKEAWVPIYLDNADEVVGLQFTITLPYAKSASKPTLVASRANGHTLSLRRLTDTQYTVVVMSMQNAALRGNAGLLLRFPIQIADEAQADETTAFGLSNIVLSVKGGRNVASQATSDATFTVQRLPSPDFVVKDVSIVGNDAALSPGGKLGLSFNVVNQGTGESAAGWTEKIYLEDAAGARWFIASKNYPNTLPAATTLPRAYEVDIPQIVGTDGTVRAVVELVQQQGAGELVADQGNNEAVSIGTRELARRITFSAQRIVLEEGDSRDITLSRSGDRSLEETFVLSEQNALGQTLLTLPATVTIPAGQSGRVFRVSAIDDSEVNDTYRTGITATGGDYEAASMTVDVEDNDLYALALTTDKTAYTEGDEVVLTATIDRTRTEDLKVAITNTATARFYPYVRSITIPAGQLSAQATTAVVDDHYPMADVAVTWTAQATGFETAKATATVTDDDWPVLTLALSKGIISEADGYGATMLTITRDGSTAENLTTYIRSNAGLQLYYDSQYNIIPAGQRSVTIPVSVEDNSLVDGERTFTLSVAACDAQTGRAVAAGHKSCATIDLTITDDDTDRALKLQGTTAQLSLNGRGATLTVSRNTTSGACVVSLASESALLAFPATVTIPAGQTSATFEVKAAADGTVADGQTAAIVATAADYQRAAFSFVVSSLPDAVTSAPQLPSSKPFGGQTVDVTIDVTNQGTSTLEPGMNVRFYLGKTPQVEYDRFLGIPLLTEIAKYELTETVAAGETVAMTFPVTLPANQELREYYMFAWLNYEGKFPEANTGNNCSESALAYIQPAFTLASIATDKKAYGQGAAIHFTGQMSNSISGLPMEGKSVDVYLLDEKNQRRSVATTLDADGRFSVTYQMPSLVGGTFLAGACVSGVGTSETGARLTVSALAFEGSYLMEAGLTEGVAFEGDVKLTNLSPEALHDVAFEWTGLPEGWTVELPSKIATLQGGAHTLVHYRLVPTTPSALVRGGLTATAHGSDEGITASTTYPTYVKAARATSNLVTDRTTNTISTTITRDGERTLTLRVGNTGLKESGTIRVACSTGQQWLTANTTALASLANGETAAIELTLTGQADMIVDGTYEAKVRLTPENSDYVDVTVRATVVGTDLATLVVDVVDAFTLGTEDGTEGPHVSGATVRLTNNLTGEVAMTGTTGSDGLFRTELLKEGTYDVYVTAPNHYFAQRTITVDPGQENTVQVFLNYEAVKMTYTVERTTVQDEYKTALIMDIVPDIPQAIVVPNLPGNWGSGSSTHSIRLTNQGRLTAYTPYLEFPNVEGVTFTVLTDYPDVIYPNESYDVTVQFDGPVTATKTQLGYITMHYGYRLTDGMHYGSENYAAAMGSGDLVFLPSGGLGTAGDNAKDRNYGSYNPKSVYDDMFGVFDMGGDLDGVGEPKIQVRDYTKSVDNRIRLKIEQKFLLEREAFRGTLVVENQQMDAIEHITLVPNVKRTDGTDATDLFAISTSKDEDDNWTLASAATEQASVLYVPSKETAPTEPVDYLFGGTVSYRDVATGNLITVELTPTQLSVNPSPDLHLMYFVQRDFISDDPATEEVEPWEPTQFALLIQNKGAGAALDLKIETKDPQIVENLNNLPVKFTALYSTIDGKEGNYSWSKLDLGRIEPGQNVMARWWYYCNVSAHVANYDVQMIKASNYGEEFNLITLDGVRELTRTVCGSLVHNHAAGAPRRAKGEAAIDATSNIFLLNLIPDNDNLPDYVMDETGEGTDDLEIVSESVGLGEGSETGEYVLTVAASRAGWVYGALHDPTNGTQELARVIRQSDGADVTANFWQTDRTVTADFTTLTDNRLHLADNIGTAETYKLYYESRNVATGDVNADGLVNIADVMAIRAHILGQTPAGFSEQAADLTGDGAVTIDDVQKLNTMILNQ